MNRTKLLVASLLLCLCALALALALPRAATPRAAAAAALTPEPVAQEEAAPVEVTTAAGLTLVGNVPAPQRGPGFRLISLRNDSGKAVAAFIAARDDKAGLNDRSFKTRSFVSGFDDEPLAPGATTDIPVTGGKPYRVVAVAFADGTVVGPDPSVVAFLRVKLNDFEDGLRAQLPKMRAALNGTDREAAAAAYLNSLGTEQPVEGAHAVVIQANPVEGLLMGASRNLRGRGKEHAALKALAAKAEARAARGRRYR